MTGSSVYPGSIDSFQDVEPNDPRKDATSPSALADNHSAALVAIEDELGTNPSASDASVAARLLAIEAGRPIPPGTVVMFAGEAAPSGWLLCDGTQVQVSTYAALYAAITTKYNQPTDLDASKFRVPDLRVRIPIGKDTGTPAVSDVGKTGGALGHIHDQPQHVHPGIAHQHAVTSQLGGTGAITTDTGADYTVSDVNPGGGATRAGRHDHQVSFPSFNTLVTTTAELGAGDDNTTSSDPPFMALNFIIKT